MISERQAHKYCSDDISKIENYDKAIADTTQTWDLHHRLELTLEGEDALSVAQLKMHDMYYHRPYYELIFLTLSEHRSIHHKCRSYITGENNPMYGKHHSNDTKLKISESSKGRIFSPEARRKISEAAKRRRASIKK